MESTPSAPHAVALAVRTIVPSSASAAALATVDRARVAAVRPPDEVISETTAQIQPGASTLTVELEVLLSAPVEQLVLVVELWAGDLLAFSGEQVITVDSSQPVTTVSTVNLVPIAPALTVTPLALNYSVIAGSGPSELAFTVGNAGGGTLDWTATTDVTGLSVEPRTGVVSPGQATTVLAVENPGQMQPGSYGGSITVSAPAALSSPQVIAVTVEVTEPPTIELSALSLDFTAPQFTDPAPQDLTLANTGGSTLRWFATVEAGWLTVTPSSGSVLPQESVTLTISPSTRDLLQGRYSAIIIFQDPSASNSPQVVSVNVNVTRAPRIGLSATSLSLDGWTDADPADQSLVLSNVGGSTLNWTASGDVTWLSVSPSSGSLPEGASASLSVGASVQGLSVGRHPTTLVISDPAASNSPQNVSVVLTVAERPRISLSPTSMTFSDPCEGDPPAQTLSITNTGGSDLRWNATSGAGWLTTSPSSGTVAAGQSQLVSVLAQGGLPYVFPNRTTTLSVRDPDATNSPQTVSVELVSCGEAPSE